MRRGGARDGMKGSKIDFFFSELDREFRKPAEVIVTGAACAALMGYVRPSADIDFEIQFNHLYNICKSKLTIAI